MIELRVARLVLRQLLGHLGSVPRAESLGVR
jgi:hypothetical protein